MELWWKHTSKIFEIWAYSCMRNHFHVAGYVKDEKDVKDLTGLTGTTVDRDLKVGKAISPSDSRGDLSGLKEPSQYFSNCFNAYSRGVNLAVGRMGALFERPFKRIPIPSEAI